MWNNLSSMRLQSYIYSCELKSITISFCREINFPSIQCLKYENTCLSSRTFPFSVIKNDERFRLCSRAMRCIHPMWASGASMTRTEINTGKFISDVHPTQQYAIMMIKYIYYQDLWWTVIMYLFATLRHFHNQSLERSSRNEIIKLICLFLLYYRMWTLHFCLSPNWPGGAKLTQT